MLKIQTIFLSFSLLGFHDWGDFIGYSFGISRKKASTISYGTAFQNCFKTMPIYACPPLASVSWDTRTFPHPFRGFCWRRHADGALGAHPIRRTSEGGIGVIAGAMIGMKEPDVASNPLEANLRALRREIEKAREATQGIIGVNIMVALTTFAEMVRTSIESKADVIFSGAGLPMDLPKIFNETCERKKEEFKTKLVPIISSGRAATLIARKWMSSTGYMPDAFVVEGPKAGGHLGFSPEHIVDPNYALEQLVPQVVEAVKPLEDKVGHAIPVIAAGGVYTGEDIKKYMDLGASGVQMGTRFVATYECDADDRFKQAYINAKQEDVTIIKSPVGMPGRALVNSFIDSMREGGKKPFKCIFHCVKTCEQEKTPYCIAAALINAMKGNLERGFAFCGENVSRVNSIVSVHDLIASLQREFDAIINKPAAATVKA